MKPLKMSLTVMLSLALVSSLSSALRAQEELIDRPGPPGHENFDVDANKDGVPDGWYNLRDARMIPAGGVVTPGYLRFENERPGRQARVSRAFGVDGTKTEAIIVGLWIRLEHVLPGERIGDDPGLLVDFLGPGLRTFGRGIMGSWTQSIGSKWVHVAKRIPVPIETKDAILSVGLHGATGVMSIDGMTIELVPVGGTKTTNLLLNGDFELGDPAPPFWLDEQGVHRVSPGHNKSSSALELARSGSRAMNGLGVAVDRLPALEIMMMVRGQGLRGAGGAAAAIFFLDGDGRPLPGMTVGLPLFPRWAGTFDWRLERTIVNVPQGAVRAVLQFEKADASGSVQIDDVKVVANPDASAGEWVPYHIENNTDRWKPVSPSTEILAGSALDASFLVPAPAGKLGFVNVHEKRLTFEKGGSRARFFGVALLAPTAFIDAAPADALAARLSRSGVNLVRLGDLDAPLGHGRCLLDDTRDDTQALDPLSLARLDHLIAALKSRGIYIALELLGSRRFRSGDGVEGYRGLPPGGGPAAAFDPTIRARVLKTAEQLLTHVNPETGLALRDDPVLAWVTLAGELTLFDLIEHPDLLPSDSAEALKKVSQASLGRSARQFWQATEGEQWKSLAAGLRKLKVRVPIAGSSHYRRDPAEYVSAQAPLGLDMIDDRLFWSSPLWGLAERRSMLRGQSTSLSAAADKKRHTDRPYVVGQWCSHTEGAWALPYEGADQILAALTASTEDWDGIVRRGVFLHPTVWGANSTGTGGGEDFYSIAEVVNGIPQVFALLPHAASITLRGHERVSRARPINRPPNLTRRAGVLDWDPEQGRLVIDTPFTQGLAGWSEGLAANFASLAVDVDSMYAVVVATSMSQEPISTSKRLLVTAVARVEPTGFRWVDEWRRDVADPGRPPLLQEPVRAKVLWRNKGKVQAYALDNTGKRTGPVELEKTADGVRLQIEAGTPTLHWELVEEGK